MYIKDYQVGNKVYEDIIGNLHIANTTDLDKAVYFKVLHERYSTQDDLVQAFHKSAEFYCSLDYDNHIKALEHGQENGTHYLVLEYLNLFPFEKVLNKKRILSLIDALTFIENLAKCLRVYHIDGIIHGNITSQATYCNENLTQVKISDFGFQEFISLLIQKKQTGLLNTLNYRAPELFKGNCRAERSSDIYSLGVLLYRVLLGDFPWNGNGFNLNKYQSSEISIIPPSLQRLEIPDFLDNIVLKSLDPEIENRFQNISQFINKISEAKSSIVASVTPVTSQLSQKEQPEEYDAVDPFELVNSKTFIEHDQNQIPPEQQQEIIESVKEEKADEPAPEENDGNGDVFSTEDQHSGSMSPTEEGSEQITATLQNDKRKESASFSEEETDYSHDNTEAVSENESVNIASKDEVSDSIIGFSEIENDEVELLEQESHSQTESVVNQNVDHDDLSAWNDDYNIHSSSQFENDVLFSTSKEMKIDDQPPFNQPDENDSAASPNKDIDGVASNKDDVTMKSPESDRKTDQIPASQQYSFDEDVANSDDEFSESHFLLVESQETKPTSSKDVYQFNLKQNPKPERKMPFTALDDFSDETATQTEELATTQTLNLYRSQLGGRSYRTILKFVFLSVIPLVLIFILTSFVFDFDWLARFTAFRNNSLFNGITAINQSNNEQEIPLKTSNIGNTKINSDNDIKLNDVKSNKTDLPHASELTKQNTDNNANINTLSSQTGMQGTVTSLSNQPSQSTSVTLMLSVRSGQMPLITDVYLDGKFLGKTNRDGQITVSKLALNKSYLFKVQKSGFEMWAKEIMFNRRGLINLNVVLRVQK